MLSTCFLSHVKIVESVKLHVNKHTNVAYRGFLVRYRFEINIFSVIAKCSRISFLLSKKNYQKLFIYRQAAKTVQTSVANLTNELSFYANTLCVRPQSSGKMSSVNYYLYRASQIRFATTLS